MVRVIALILTTWTSDFHTTPLEKKSYSPDQRDEAVAMLKHYQENGVPATLKELGRSD